MQIGATATNNHGIPSRAVAADITADFVAIGEPEPLTFDSAFLKTETPENTTPPAVGVQSSRPGETVQGDALEDAFHRFVGQTLFGSMLKSMRSTVGKPAYFHGGQTEEIFQSQLDAALTEELTESSADKFAGPMFELFQLQRQR